MLGTVKFFNTERALVLSPRTPGDKLLALSGNMGNHRLIICKTRSKKTATRPSKVSTGRIVADDFESVARRLRCDPDLAAFDTKQERKQ